jgi:hypothetical protein
MTRTLWVLVPFLTAQTVPTLADGQTGPRLRRHQRRRSRPFSEGVPK